MKMLGCYIKRSRHCKSTENHVLLASRVYGEHALALGVGAEQVLDLEEGHRSAKKSLCIYGTLGNFS